MFIAVIDPEMVNVLDKKGISPFDAETSTNGDSIFIYKKEDLGEVIDSLNFKESQSFYFTNKLSF